MKKLQLLTIAILLFTAQVSAQQNIRATGIAKSITVNMDQAVLEAKKFVFKPKGNAKDLTIYLQNIEAVIVINGADRQDIIMEAEGLLGLPEKAKGLRAVSTYGEDNTNMGLSVNQEGNDIKIIGTNFKRTRRATFSITVPKEINLNILYKHWGSDDLVISNITGGIEAQASIANVSLNQVSGPLSISTLSGDVTVKYGAMSVEALTVLSSSSGDIDISVSASANIDFKIKNTSGEIFTDLDMEFKKEEPIQESVRTKNNRANLTYTDQNVSVYQLATLNSNRTSTMATLNGGGIRLDIHTISGDVFLRKK